MGDLKELLLKELKDKKLSQEELEEELSKNIEDKEVVKRLDELVLAGKITFRQYGSSLIKKFDGSWRRKALDYDKDQILLMSFYYLFAGIPDKIKYFLIRNPIHFY